VKIYGIRNCDTMKKAFAFLEARKLAYDFHGWEKLANTRGPTWRNIPDADKAGLNEARALALLEKHASAIKRPVLEAGAKLLVGFVPAQYEKL
jgi:arsenate reductase